MSRTKKRGKSPGSEYWSKRPGSGEPPGEFSKNRTHRLERLEAKKAERSRDHIEYCPICDGEFESVDSDHYCDVCNYYNCECEC